MNIDLKIPGKMEFDELQLLAALSKRVPKGGKIVEIGSFFGRSTYAIAKANPAAQVFSIDTFEDVEWTQKYSGLFREVPKFTKDAFSHFTRDCPNVTAIEGYSPDVVSDWSDPIDMYFEDAIHGNPGLKINLDFWINHLKPGGIACGHDYTHRFPDIKREVDIWAERWGTKVEIVGSLWVLKKPEAPNKPKNLVTGCLPMLDPAPSLKVVTKNAKCGLRKTAAGFWAGNHLEQDKLLKASIILNKNFKESSIEYQFKYSDGQKTGWVSNGEIINCYNTINKAQPIRFTCRLTGDLAEEYGVYYRISCRQIGNGGFYKTGTSDWFSNGEWAKIKQGDTPINALTVRLLKDAPPKPQEEFTSSVKKQTQVLNLTTVKKRLRRLFA